MQRQVTAMRQALDEALTAAAETVGRGDQYAGAVREYARGVRLNDRATKAGKAVGVMAGGALGIDYIIGRMRRLLGE